jgi:hypothetical protein
MLFIRYIRRIKNINVLYTIVVNNAEKLIVEYESGRIDNKYSRCF